MNTDPIHKQCVPCEGGTKPMLGVELKTHLSYLKLPWELDEEKKRIKHKFTFKDFKESMVFINKVAEIAETEGHHPNIKIFYNKVIIELTTHSIGGLSVNDFIMARKIEEL